MKVHHIGYAVKDIDKAKISFKLLGYKEKSEVCYDKQRNLNILFIENNHLLVELISIYDVTQNSPIDFLLKKKIDNIPYHICYSVKNIEETIKELKRNDFREITRIEPAPAINNKPVAFLFHQDIGLIELVEDEI